MADYYVDDDGNITTKKKKKKSADYVVSESGKVSKVEANNNDIAPVKKYDTNVFDDGYQFGDISRATSNLRDKAKDKIKKAKTDFVKWADIEDGYQLGNIYKAYSRDSQKRMDELTDGNKEVQADYRTLRKLTNELEDIATVEDLQKWKTEYYGTLQRINASGYGHILDEEEIKETDLNVTKRRYELAPKRTWFDKGVFDDGFQWSDIPRGILGTETDLKTHIGAGFLGIGEKLADAGAVLGNAMFQQNMAQQMSYDAMANSITGKETPLVEDFVELKKETDKNTAEFIAKDLYDEEAIAKKIISDPVKAVTGVDSETDSFLGEKSDALAQSGGELLGQVAVSSIPGVGQVGGMTLMGLTTFGSEMENALNQGATYDEALFSSTISAGAEILTEKLGGISFGGKTLTDVAFKNLSRKMTNKIAKVAITSGKLTADALAEGGEELLSGYLSAAGQKLTYMEDKEIEELFTNDDKLESFIGGVVLGGAFTSVKAATSDTNIVNGMTKTEQTVVDKVYNDTVAEREANGEKLTSKEKNTIYDRVVESVKNGSLDVKAIEEALGGESYEAYKKATDENASLKKELDELNDIKAGELTGKQSDRLAELKAMNLDDTTQTDELKKKMSDDVFNLVKNDRKGQGSMLLESYREVERKGQAFADDLTKYVGKQREAIERAINSGVLNNTNRSHELVNILSKIEADKGITFDYTDNKKLKESGFAIDGKTVNGFVKDGGVTLNVQSPKAWESTVGHEITHVLEGTKAYSELQSALFKYAESKGELEARRSKLTKLYNGIDADIDTELTADLVGDYLFNDKNFVKHLTSDRNVFQKVWDEVKYLYNVATGKEKAQIEKVMREFEKAWKEHGKKTQGDKDVSFSLNNDVEETKDMVAVHNLSEEKLLKTLNLGGFPMPSVAVTKSSKGHSTYGDISVVFGKDTIDPKKSPKNEIYTRDGGTMTFPEVVPKITFNQNAYDGVVNKIESVIGKSHDFPSYDDLLKRFEPQLEESGWGNVPNSYRFNDVAMAMYEEDSLQKAFLTEKGIEGDQISEINKHEDEYREWLEDVFSEFDEDSMLYDDDFGGYMELTPENVVKVMDKNAYQYDGIEKYASLDEVKQNVERLKNIGYFEAKPKRVVGFDEISSVVIPDNSSVELKTLLEQNGIPFTEYESGNNNSRLDALNSLEDAKFSLSNAKDSNGNALSLAVQKRFANSKAVDENGNLKVLYHGTASGEFYTFDKSKGSVEGDFGSGFYFTDSESDVEANYEDGGADFDNKVARRAEQIESEEDIDYSEAEARARGELYKGGFKHSVYLNIENPAVIGETNLFDYESYAENYDRDDYDSDEDYEGDVEQLIADDIDQIIWDIEQNVDIYSTDGIADVLWNAINEGGIGIEQLKAQINELYLEDNNGNFVSNEVTRQIIESLGYDGIIDNTVSTKFNMNLEEGTTHYIVFKPNQIKSIENQNPTDNPDIRYSLSEDKLSKDIENFDNSWYNEIKLSFTEQERVQSEALTWNADKRNQIITQSLSNGITYRYMIDDEGIVHIYERKTSKNNHEERGKYYVDGGREKLDSVAKELWVGQRNNNINSGFSRYRRKYGKDDTNDNYFVPGEGRSNGTGHSKNRTNANRKPKEWKFGEDGSVEVTYSDGTKETEDIAPTKRASSADGVFFDAKKHSLSPENEAPSTIGTPLKDLYLAPTQEDIAPVKASATTNADMFPEDYAPATAEEVEALNKESVEEFDAPMLENIPILPDSELEQGTIAAIKPKPEKQPRLKKVDNAESEEHVAQVLTEEPKTEKKKKRIISTAIRNFIDKGAVFENLSLKKKNRVLQDTYKAMGRSETKAQYFMENGTKGVKSLDSIIEEVEHTGKTKEFFEYLYHKHNVDRMSLESKEQPNLERLTAEMGKLKLLNLQENQLRAIASEKITAETKPKRAELIKTVREYLKSKDVKNKPVFDYSVTAEMSQETAKQYEEANPKFKEFAQDVYNYMNHLRDMMVEKGVISQETAELWAKMYPHFVPIRRANHDGLAVNVPLDTNKTGINAPIKRATGGNSDILPLFNTMAQRTMQTFKAIDKNRFGVELKNTLDSVVESTKTSLDEVIDSIDTHEDLLQAGKNGRNPTFTVFEGGERITFDITEEMYDALKPTSEGLMYTNKVLNTASNLHRGVLTEYSVPFMVTNAIKDAQDVLINSQHPAETYANSPVAIKELLTKGKWYTEYMENGGGDNTYFDKQTNDFGKEKSTLRKVVGFPFDKISDANNFIEKVPRLAEYIASRKKGASVDAAMLDSARVTTDFSAGGDVTKFLNRNGATFLNASVQGFAQQVRNVREAKANGLKGWLGLATKYAIAGLPAMLLNHLLWDDDEEYEELSDYVKENYYVVAKYGDGKFVRIPKGRALAVIQNAFEQTSNALTGNDEVDFGRFFELAISNLAPNNPLDNNIIAPIKQVMENKTWYGEDLVPTSLQDVPAAEQYDESTDSISKWLGENLNVSPYKINYLLNQYSGGVGDVFLPMLTPEAESGDDSFGGNLIAPLKDKFTTDSVMNNQNVSNFYDKKDELTVNANASGATDEDILKSKYINSINTEMSELYKRKREIQNGNLPDNEKYNAVREIQRQINTIAKESLNAYENVSISGNYATVGDLHYKLTDDGKWQKLSDDEVEKQEAVTSELGTSASDYWENKKEQDYAYKYPEKYAVAKSVGGYSSYTQYTKDINKVEGDDFDGDGRTDSGSKKKNVYNYIFNEMDLDYGAKCVLFKSKYPKVDDYGISDEYIVNYILDNQDLTEDEKISALTELEYTVKDGYVYWD